MRARLSLMTATVMLVACAAPPLPPGPRDLAPPRFNVGPDTGTGAALMARAFADSQPFERLIAEVLDRNLDLRLAATRVRQAQALSDAATSARWPTGEATAEAKRQRVPDGKGAVNTGNALTLQTTAAWELDFWGRLSAQDQAVALDVQATALDRDAAQLSLAATSASLQADLIALGHRLQLAKETAQVQSQLLALVEARLAAGRATALDQARAAGLLATTQASVPALRNAACLTRLRLDLLRGQPPSDCAAADADPLPAMPDPRRVSLGALPNPAGLLAQRPDVRAAFVRADAAAARAHQAWAARWPTLKLSGDVGWSADSAVDLLKRSSLGASLGAGLTWQWLDFGRRKAEESAARAGFEAAVAAAEGAQLQALQEAQASLEALNDTEAQAAAQAQAAAAATRARDLARQRYEAGVADFFSLLDAERERLSAQDRLIQLQAQRATVLLGVHKAFAAGLTAP